MCQVVKYYFSCTHTDRYRLVNACSFGFCPNARSCIGNNNQIMAYRPVPTSLWCEPCLRRRHQIILAVHRLLMYDVCAQAEREGWSNHSIGQAMRRCREQEDKEIGSFLAAVEEAENRNARLYRVRRGQHYGDSDSGGG